MQTHITEPPCFLSKLGFHGILFEHILHQVNLTYNFKCKAPEKKGGVGGGQIHQSPLVI